MKGNNVIRKVKEVRGKEGWKGRKEGKKERKGKKESINVKKK